jgi:hypothetical protein
MYIVLYRPYSRAPGYLGQTPINTQSKTTVHQLSNRKYSTKDGYADDGNTPGPLKISKPEQSNKRIEGTTKQLQTTGDINLPGKPDSHRSH